MQSIGLSQIYRLLVKFYSHSILELVPTRHRRIWGRADGAIQ
jgi:hypothetical protein